MSIFMKATMKVNAHKAGEFMAVLQNKLIPLMEEQGWRLHGCFVQRFGPIQPLVVIDIWEMEDMAHVDRVFKDFSYRSNPAYQEAMPVLQSAVIEETLEFMELKMGSLKPYYP